MKITNKIKISSLKYYAIKLRANYQLPYYLCYLIRQLRDDTDINVVALLSRLSEDLMRLKGYYKKYPSAEQSANEALKKQIAFENNNYVIFNNEEGR